MPSKLEARVSKHDTEIAAIRKLIRLGMRLLADTQIKLNEIADAHKETEKSLNRFIRSMERGSVRNGRAKTDLQ
jgi:hypothetical protein